MGKENDTPLKVSKITKDRVRYAAASLGMTQGEMVETAMLNVFRQINPELDDLTQAFIHGDMEGIKSGRAKALGKLAVNGEPAGQNTLAD